MAKLNAATRNALPASDFAGPDRSFPVPDPSHARDALARVTKKSPAVKAAVKRKVAKKFPSIKISSGAPKYPKEAGEYVS